MNTTLHVCLLSKARTHACTHACRAWWERCRQRPAVARAAATHRQRVVQQPHDDAEHEDVDQLPQEAHSHAHAAAAAAPQSTEHRALLSVGVCDMGDGGGGATAQQAQSLRLLGAVASAGKGGGST